MKLPNPYLYAKGRRKWWFILCLKKNGANSGKCNILIERLNAHIFNIHALGSGRDYKNKCMHANIFNKKQWNVFKFVEKINKFATDFCDKMTF